jgi:hypothetical protein
VEGRWLSYLQAPYGNWLKRLDLLMAMAIFPSQAPGKAAQMVALARWELNYALLLSIVGKNQSDYELLLYP